MKFFFIYLILAMASIDAKSLKDEFNLTLRLEKEEVLVGQTVLLTLDAVHPPGFHIDQENLKTNLVQYLGYGMPPFKLIHAELVKETASNTQIRYLLEPQVPGTFDLSFGIVTFKNEDEIITILSAAVTATIKLGPLDSSFVPPIPPFLLLKPLLPVEIDLEMKQKLISDPDILSKEHLSWQHSFLLRKIPFYALALGLITTALFMINHARNRSPQKPFFRKNTDAILKELLLTMRNIQAKQKEGSISPEEALVKMQKALINCFTIRLKIPASKMTVEELKNALLQIESIQGSSRDDMDILLDLTLGIKFGKKTVKREESIQIMENSLKALENLVYNSQKSYN